MVSSDEGFLVGIESSRRDGLSGPRDEAQVEMQIVEGKQPQTEDFTGFEEVSEVGSGESGHMGMAGLANWGRILGMIGIFDL